MKCHLCYTLCHALEICSSSSKIVLSRNKYNLLPSPARMFIKIGVVSIYKVMWVYVHALYLPIRRHVWLRGHAGQKYEPLRVPLLTQYIDFSWNTSPRSHFWEILQCAVLLPYVMRSWRCMHLPCKVNWSAYRDFLAFSAFLLLAAYTIRSLR